MKNLLSAFAVLVFLGFGLPGISEENTLSSKEFEEVELEIKLVISDQIRAFKRLDLERAYYHASESIKTVFPSSKMFGIMVQKSYPMIWAPKEYRFLLASPLSGGVIQRVLFTDNRGGMHFFDYELKNNGKRWVISGVYMAAGEAGA